MHLTQVVVTESFHRNAEHTVFHTSLLYRVTSSHALFFHWTKATQRCSGACLQWTTSSLFFNDVGADWAANPMSFPLFVSRKYPFMEGIWDFYRHTINFRLGVSDCLASKISVSLPWGSEFNICVSRITASFCSVRYILTERVFPVRYRFESVFWSKFLLSALLLLYHICFPEENVQVPEEDSGGESGEECAGGGYVWQRNIKPAGYSWTLWVCWIDSVTFKVESYLLCLGWCVKKCLKIKST